MHAVSCATFSDAHIHIAITVPKYIVIMLLFLSIGTYNKDLQKVVYLDNRRYLPIDSSLRNETVEFPSKQEELSIAPPKRNFDSIKIYHKAVDNAK